jgi:hypothetical protein
MSAIADRRTADWLHAIAYQPPAVDTSYDEHLSRELAAAMRPDPESETRRSPERNDRSMPVRIRGVRRE